MKRAAKKLTLATKRRLKELESRLLELRKQKPFHPFRVLMKDGSEHAVGERLWFAFGGNTLVVLPNGGLTRILKLDQVESLELINS
jgi:hypothetical protein